MGAAATVTVPFRAVTFEPNLGQTDTRVKYLAHSAGATLWLTGKGVVLEPRSGSALVKLRFLGANPRPRMEAEERRSGVSNYFIGRDADNWRTGIPQFGKVRYRDIYPGIDAVFYGNTSEIEYDFVVSPGANPAKIRLAFDGADSIAADAAGDLLVRIGGREMRSRKPRIYQKVGAGEKAVNGRYAVLGKRSAGFVIDRYDSARPLVVDPVLSYATFLGGELNDAANAIAMDAQGNLYVAGNTNSALFPEKASVKPGLTNATGVAFIAKINPAASGGDSLIYSSYIGGNISDQALGVAVDASNNVYIAGQTFSTDFPLKNAFQTSFNTATNCPDAAGNKNAIKCTHSFVTKIAASGQALVYSSYLGGSESDAANAIAVDAAGNAYITGQTTSTDFPTAGTPYLSTLKGTANAFLSKVNASGSSLAYSTYFGGTSSENAVSVAVSPSGMAYIVGSTRSNNLPTSSGAFQSATSGGPGDSYLAVFNPSQGGSGSLTYATYLGGKDGTTVANGVTVDGAGVVYITGATNADDFPVSSGAFSSKYAGSLSVGGTPGVGDAFITKLNTSSSGSGQLVYSTFFGGALDDQGFGIAVDASGRITVAGVTNSLAFPVTGDAFQRYDAGPSPTNQGFVARFDPSKSGQASLLYSTYLGGNQDDELFSVAIDPTGNKVAVAGTVQSFNPPITPSAFQKSFGGAGSTSGDAYVAEFDFTKQGPGLSSVVNAASLMDTGLSPGLIFTVRGSGIGPSTAQEATNVGGKLPATLGGVQLLVDNTPAPMLFVSRDQINAVAPYELGDRFGDTVNVQVVSNGVGGPLIGSTVVIAAPAVFTSGKGQGIILNQDSTPNGTRNPAAAGSVIRIFATGEGSIQPGGVDGKYVGSSNLPRPILPVTLTIGGVNATVKFAGTSPGGFEGFFEVDAQVPDGTAHGNNPVVVTVGGISSMPVNVVLQ